MFLAMCLVKLHLFLVTFSYKWKLWLIVIISSLGPQGLKKIRKIFVILKTNSKLHNLSIMKEKIFHFLSFLTDWISLYLFLFLTVSNIVDFFYEFGLTVRLSGRVATCINVVVLPINYYNVIVHHCVMSKTENEVCKVYGQLTATLKVHIYKSCLILMTIILSPYSS